MKTFPTKKSLDSSTIEDFFWDNTEFTDSRKNGTQITFVS